MVVFLGGCRGGSKPGALAQRGPDQQAGVKKYHIRGIVVASDAKTGAVTVDTDAIPEYMDAMTMPYTLAQPNIATELHPGDTITATLTASAGSVAKTFALQLGATVPTLSINVTSVSFGNVDLNIATTQSIILSSTGTGAVTVSGAAVTGTGFTLSGSSFPLTLNSGQTATLSVVFDPTVTGAATGQLTITSNSSTNGTAVVSLNGTGQTAVSYEVDLTWSAPASSSDPVAGYNVYRTPTGTSSYQLLNSTALTQTAYTDTTVQAGQTYDYMVESVDASGVQSAPSNVAAVSTP